MNENATKTVQENIGGLQRLKEKTGAMAEDAKKSYKQTNNSKQHKNHKNKDKNKKEKKESAQQNDEKINENKKTKKEKIVEKSHQFFHKKKKQEKKVKTREAVIEAENSSSDANSSNSNHDSILEEKYDNVIAITDDKKENKSEEFKVENISEVGNKEIVESNKNAPKENENEWKTFDGLIDQKQQQKKQYLIKPSIFRPLPKVSNENLENIWKDRQHKSNLAKAKAVLQYYARDFSPMKHNKEEVSNLIVADGTLQDLVVGLHQIKKIEGGALHQIEKFILAKVPGIRRKQVAEKISSIVDDNEGGRVNSFSNS